MIKSKEQIQVTINKIIYLKEDTSWYILKTSGGIAKGTVNFAVKNGDFLCLEGFYQISKFNGEQEFIFSTAMLSIPEDPRALLKYAVEITKGLGPAAEDKIWAHYREKWRESDLADISGITEDARFNWQTTLKRLEEQKSQAQAISFLLSKGATLNMACAAWNIWNDSTISIVSADCYRLADLPYYGFTDVDQKIRQNFGITDSDHRRIEAAILYVMGNITQRDGTLVERITLLNELIKIIPDAITIFEESLQELQKLNKVVMPDLDNVALFSDWQNETAIWDAINGKIKDEHGNQV